jgi:hypothetical protein
MLKVVPDISGPKKSRHYFEALNEREIGRSFSDSLAFMTVPVSIYGKSHPYIVLQYTPKNTQKKVKFLVKD